MNNNYCSNCGHRTYQHARGRCQHVETVGHIVRITEDDWTLKHPLAERDNDKLFNCSIHDSISVPAGTLATWPEPGEYSIEMDRGVWVFGPPEAAHQQCDCEDVDSVINRARTAMDGDGPGEMYKNPGQAVLWANLVRGLVTEIETLRNAR